MTQTTTASAADAGDAPDRPLDVLIVGAGLSGIGMAARLTLELPHLRYAILEARGAVGGTWDLFRYPGIRSDSDMHTLGYEFEPWTEAEAIADGPSILAYINRVADQYAIRDAIRFDTKVTSADWDSAAALWTVTATGPDGTESRHHARFLYMAAGYYDYGAGHRPSFPDEAAFAGPIIHPQFWPEGLEVAGKRVAIIGSGATAVTLVPALAARGARPTMIQRTPTWYIRRPSQDRVANLLRGLLGEARAYRLVRWRNVRLQRWLFNRARRSPAKVGAYLQEQVRKVLGPAFRREDFQPPYGPWEQRLCLVPDDDLFTALKDGTAAIATGRIERFTRDAVVLTDGRTVATDIIVTATGLTLAVGGKAVIRVDGVEMPVNERFYYKGCMFSDLPNFAVVFGYLNASWTLKADLVARYVCRVLRAMADGGFDYVVPATPAHGIRPAPATFDFSSGYVQRSLALLPRAGADAPWRLDQDYLTDRKTLRDDLVNDGVLLFRRAGEPAIGVVDPRHREVQAAQ